MQDKYNYKKPRSLLAFRLKFRHDFVLKTNHLKDRDLCFLSVKISMIYTKLII